MWVVVDQGMRTAAATWETLAKRSLALSLLSSDNRSIAEQNVLQHSVLQSRLLQVLQQLLLLLLRASQQQKEVVVHQSGREPSERAVGGAE